MATLEKLHTVYLGLGSNQGDRAVQLHEALRLLAPYLQVTRVSSIYETPPWGYTEQPPFLNAVARGGTRLHPEHLLEALKQVEQMLGRVPGPRYGPRPIDLDILLYNDIQHSSSGLTIPHPRIAERSFVLVPLAEIAPNLRLTPNGPTVRELLNARDDREHIRRVGGFNLLSAADGADGSLS